MPICSYLVIPGEGRSVVVAERLRNLPGCEVAPARNRDLLLLVTDTPGPEEDAELRDTLEGMQDIQALVLAFGQIDPETSEGDPLGSRKKRRRKDPGGRRPLPVVDQGGLGASRSVGRSGAPWVSSPPEGERGEGGR
ncbi:MAG: hypothetical protein WD960_10055 [Gemmatimonadota bacterium]